MPCVDNPNYVSAIGLNCAQHKRLVCAKLGSVGLSTDQVKELRTNCPSSCDVSACGDGDDKTHGGFDDLIAQNIEDKNIETDSTSTKPTPNMSAMNKISRNLNEFGACFPGWDPSCRDDSSYISPIGLDCNGFQTMGCDVFGKVGFTDEEVEELKSRCPCSCQLACPAPTALPSSTPSTSPPTLVPTFSPSSLPSSNPTPRPTDEPTEKPTMFPTQFPTKAPSPSPSTAPSSPPTNKPTITQQPSVSFSPTHAPTTFSQLNRLPNRPIRASNGGVDGTPIIAQTNGSGMDFSIHQLVIICVSFCAFVAFGVALIINVKKNSKRIKERRQQRRNIRRKRIRATKREVRRKISTFKKNRRGVFASNEEYSTQNRRSRNNAYDSYDGSRRRRNQSQNHLECRGLALPARDRNQSYRGGSSRRLSRRQDSFDSSVSSDARHTHTSGRRRTRANKRKKKEMSVYKGAEFLKPVSRGGKEDLCMAVVEKVDSAINEKMSRDFQAESQSVSSRSSRWTKATKDTDHFIDNSRSSRRGNISPLKGRLRTSRSSNEDFNMAAGRSDRATDLTLSGDDHTIINRTERGMLGELADDVADAVDDLKLIFK